MPTGVPPSGEYVELAAAYVRTVSKPGYCFQKHSSSGGILLPIARRLMVFFGNRAILVYDFLNLFLALLPLQSRRAACSRRSSWNQKSGKDNQAACGHRHDSSRSFQDFSAFAIINRLRLTNRLIVIFIHKTPLVRNYFEFGKRTAHGQALHELPGRWPYLTCTAGHPGG